jgi:hypothetical protein
MKSLTIRCLLGLGFIFASHGVHAGVAHAEVTDLRNAAEHASIPTMRNPGLAFDIGKALFLRQWERSDGVYLRRQFRAVGATATSCAMCHNTPFQTPGTGGTVFDPPGLGRNVPHLFGVGLIEAMAEEVSRKLNEKLDRDRNGIVERSELTKKTLIVPIGNGRVLNLGSLSDGEASLNPALRLAYFGPAGQRLYNDPARPALALSSPGVAGIRFEMIPFGASISDHQFTSLEDFTRGVFFSAFGMQVTELPKLFPSTSTSACAALGVTKSEIDLISFFLRNHPPPAPPFQSRTVTRGQRLMEKFNCVSCHIPSWSTVPPSAPKRFASIQDGSSLSSYAADEQKRLSGTWRYPPSPVHRIEASEKGRPLAALYVYTDLLHHDVGQKFYDVFQDKDKIFVIKKFKTPPLWGIGSTAPYGHDGRSPTLDHVIRRHAGDAKSAALAYSSSSASQRKALVAYLSLLRLQPLSVSTAGLDPRSEVREAARLFLTEGSLYERDSDSEVIASATSKRDDQSPELEDVCNVFAPKAETQGIKTVLVSPPDSIESALLRLSVKFHLQPRMVNSILSNLVTRRDGGHTIVELRFPKSSNRDSDVGPSFESIGRFLLIELRRDEISRLHAEGTSR